MSVPAEAVPGTRRARVLAHLAAHPGLTADELARVLGLGPSGRDLLQDMRRKAQVVTATEWRARQGREVSLWYAAPPGAVPPPAAAGEAERRRRRGREAQRRRRARARGLLVQPGVVSLPSGAACRGADPGLFFAAEGEMPEERQARTARATAICAGCPVRAQCYDLARANAEPWGIWGGVDFAAASGEKGRRAS